VQIGFDQEHALILVDVPPGLEQVLNLLDGCHHEREVRRTAADLGIADSVVTWTLRTLDAATLLVDGLSPAPEPAGRRVRLIGAGQLGRAVASLLVTSGLDVLYLVDPAPRDPSLYPVAGALGTQADALRADLAEPGDPRVRVLNHWSKPEELAPDLTVVAADSLECDRVMVAGLLRSDQPHLLLRPRAGGVVVGPLVLPGQTACLGCTDLTRREADPAWPTLLPQLQRTTAPVTTALAAWAGAVAVAQTLAFLQGGAAETCGATLEISPVDHVMRRRSWAMHPACGCGWQATAQWGA
jgi:hypothetical protein